MNEINCIKKDQSLIRATEQFPPHWDCCFKLRCLEERVERKDIHVLLAFGDITHFIIIIIIYLTHYAFIH